MPKIAGVNVVGVVLATLGFFFVGFLWYGVLFSQAWVTEILSARGALEAAETLTAEGLRQRFTETFPGANPGLSMGLGFLNTLLTVIVMAVVLRAMGAAGLMGHATRALLLWLGFTLTMLAYDHIYAMESITLFWIDATHTLVGYVVAAAILSFFSGD